MLLYPLYLLATNQVIKVILAFLEARRLRQFHDEENNFMPGHAIVPLVTKNNGLVEKFELLVIKKTPPMCAGFVHIFACQFNEQQA
jgi:hypothetical protein